MFYKHQGRRLRVVKTDDKRTAILRDCHNTAHAGHSAIKMQWLLELQNNIGGKGFTMMLLMGKKLCILFYAPKGRI